MPRDVAAYICSLLLSLAFCAGLSKQQQPQAPLISANSSSAVDKSRVNQTTVATPVVQGPAKVQVGSTAIVTCSVNVSMELNEDYHVRWDTTSLKTSIYEANNTRTATGYLLFLTIHSAAVEDLFDKPVLCINEGPAGEASASWKPQAIAPPQMPVIAGPRSLQKNTNITAACSTKGALGRKPDVMWLDLSNSNVTAYETSDVLTNVTIEKIPYWNVTAFLQPALDSALGNKSFVCQVTHSETKSIFKKEYTFEVTDDMSNETSSGNVSSRTTATNKSGRGEGAREFRKGLSWLLRRVKRTPSSGDDQVHDSSHPTDDNEALSSHAIETFNGVKEVDDFTKDLEIPFLKPENLKKEFGSPSSKRSFHPNSLAVWSPDRYQTAKHVYIIVGGVFLSALIILVVFTYLRRNNVNCYCC